MKSIDNNKWTNKKIQFIVDFFGPSFIKGKKILDLGSGQCDISGALIRLGASVTAVDVRQDNLKIAQKKYSGIKTIIADLDKEWQFKNQKFDIILDFGVLCHLKDYKKHIKDICSSATYVVVETSVLDSLISGDELSLPESRNNSQLAYNGFGCKPSPSSIESELLQNNFNYLQLNNSNYDCTGISYSWASSGDRLHDFGKRKIWVCANKSTPIQLDYFNTYVLKNIDELTKKEPEPENNYKNIKVIKPQEKKQRTSIPLENSGIKVAVCLSGHLRTFNDAYPALKKYLLDLYDCDVFIHTWDMLGVQIRGADAPVSRKKADVEINRVCNLLHPKKITVEQSRQFQISNLIRHKNYEGRDVSGMQSMFYKIEQCNTLKTSYEKENNFKYDCVVRIRPDIVLESPIIIKKDELEYLHIPNHGDYGGFNDQMAFSSSQIMDIYSSLYSKLHKYLEMGAYMNPEKLVKFNADMNGLKVMRPHIVYYIKRPNGHIFRNADLETFLGFRK